MSKQCWKMVPLDLLNTGLPQTSNFWKKKNYVSEKCVKWSIINLSHKCDKMRFQVGLG